MDFKKNSLKPLWRRRQPSNLVQNNSCISADSQLSSSTFDSWFLDLGVSYLQIGHRIKCIAPLRQKLFNSALQPKCAQHRLDFGSQSNFQKYDPALLPISFRSRKFHWVRSVSKTRIPAWLFPPNPIHLQHRSSLSGSLTLWFRLFDWKKIAVGADNKG